MTDPDHVFSPVFLSNENIGIHKNQTSMKTMKNNRFIQPLPAASLYTRCHLGDYKFNTTEELEKIGVVVGQERAFDALDFGIRIKSCGYNLFALGPTGTGKFTAVRQIVGQTATERPPAPDWCYVNNFNESHKPTALCLSFRH